MVIKWLLHFYVGVEGNWIRGGEGDGGVGKEDDCDTNKQGKEGENEWKLSVFVECFNKICHS